MLLAKCSLIFTIQLLFRVAYFYIYKGIFSPDYDSDVHFFRVFTHSHLLKSFSFKEKTPNKISFYHSTPTSRWNSTWRCYSALCLFLDSFLHLQTVKPDSCVLNWTMASMEIQLLLFLLGGLFLLDVPQFTTPDLFCLFKVVEQHLLGLHSCPESPVWKLQYLKSALNLHFFLFIHLSATLARQATWTLLESAHLNFNWKSSIQPVLGGLPSILGGKKKQSSNYYRPEWVF